MTVEIDWAGILRTAEALGGEGTVVLALATSERYDVEILDAALPPPSASPANGGWSAGRSGWLLLVEGLHDVLAPFVERLAQALTGSGVDGLLTGAPVAAPPAWSRSCHEWPTLQASFLCRGPAREPGVLISLGLSWLTAHGGDTVVPAGGVGLPVDPRTAAAMMTSAFAETGATGAEGFDQQRREVRSVAVGARAAAAPATVELGINSAERSWQENVAELRTAMIAAPVEQFAQASLGQEGLECCLAFEPDADTYEPMVYSYLQHPEAWGEYLLVPRGVQVVTDTQLVKAHDLSQWRTTRLNSTHLLLEARDLEPWYAAPRRATESPDAELLAAARSDFGAMILTPQRASQIGLWTSWQ